MNLRDSGLNVSYALRKEAIAEKRQSWKSATENGFKVGTIEELIPEADLVGNLTPDKQHTKALSSVVPLMKKMLPFGIVTVSISSKKAFKYEKTLRLL